jgi:hypothetical protein
MSNTYTFEPGLYLYILLFIGVYLLFAYILIAEKRKRNGKTELLKPAFYAKTPNKIKYATKPISKENNESIDITPDVLARLCELKQWTETLLIPSNYRKMKTPLTTPQEIEAKIEERLNNPLDTLIVCEIDARVGKGIFLSPEADPIPYDTLIGIYAGEFRTSKQYKDCKDFTYCMSLLSLTDEKEVTNAPYIDATYYGNLTRLFQDLPSQEEIDAVENLSTEMYNQIALENIKVLPALYHGFPVMYFVTTREINPSEQIGFSYRGEYWKDIIDRRRIFNKSGRLLGRFSSENKLEFEIDIESNKMTAMGNLDSRD